MEQTLSEALKNREIRTVRTLLNEMNVADIADELEQMEVQQAVRLFRILPKDMAAEVFAYLSRDVRKHIVNAITDLEIGRIIDDLFLDDAVDFIEEMPANVVKRVLKNVPENKRNIINQFLQYPDDSAGSVMTIEYVALKENMTVAKAFAHIRKSGIDKETIYTCYVVDSDRKLLGTVSVRTLLLADTAALVGDIMERNVISVVTAEDRETMVSYFNKYDFMAIPVVDNENRLVGIVTIDDALDVQEEEATEDFEIMAAMSPSEEPYMKTSVWKLTKNRILWLLLLMLSATMTGAIITSFEESLAAVPALIAFIPLLMGTGGNAGSQTATLVIRGMALEEVALSDVWLAWWKELRVAVLCGAALAIVNFSRIKLLGGDFLLAITVSLALYATVILAKSIGCLLPIGAKKMKLDPAIMASPLITTIVDASSLVMYFMIAKAVLRI